LGFNPDTTARRYPLRIIGLLLVLFMALPMFILGGSIPTKADEYRLGIQDRLRIYVAEWPALTNEFEVGASGSVVLAHRG
jgi:exopolysaccharide production protein ExoF